MSASLTLAIDVRTGARFFRVLGDPTRLRILELLHRGERSVGELVAAVGQPQPRVSTHLACLRQCGFGPPSAEAGRLSISWSSTALMVCWVKPPR